MLAIPAWIVALVVLFYLRAQHVDAVIGGYVGCTGCFRLPALGHDLWLLGGASTLLALASLSARAWLQRVLRAPVACLIIVAFVDLLLFDLLTQRLHLADVFKFGGEFAANWSVFESSLHSAPGMLRAILAILVAGLLVLGFRAEPRRPRRAGMLASLALACSAAAIVIHATQPVHYVHAAFVHNVIDVNLPQGSTKLFSAGHIARQRALAAQLPQICEQNPSPTRPNVIVVLAESLSAWHSRLLGAEHDWTPRLDAIAQSSHYFTRFHANGFTTSGAEIAIGSGLLPINPPGALEYAFTHFAVGRHSLPGIAASAGYQSLFFTPGDTGFLGVGEWLRSIGFDEVHGSDDPYYAGFPRGQFHAVEDSVFNDRFLSWLDARQDDRPFVSILLTVTSHPPFLDPATRKIDPQASFRYVDTQLGLLHDALDARGFYDHGILIVMGDHRTMTPLLEQEYRNFGERAYARVPMIVIGAVDMPKAVEGPFQQTDLLPSLAWVFGAQHCRNVYTGSFLRPDPQPPALVVHARGDDRNRVDVYHGENAVSGYLLNGDGSGWLDPPPVDAARIAAWIDTQRDDARQRAIDAAKVK